jgi:periplasmic divalent cation tolerance protein
LGSRCDKEDVAGVGGNWYNGVKVGWRMQAQFRGATSLAREIAAIMNDLWQVSTTTGTRDVAERIAVELVDLRLAACAQVSGPITSVYRWQGKIESAEEWVCTAKTSRQHVPAIQDVLKRLHPYELPELIATPIVGGSEAYLKWLAEQLTTND